MCVLENKGVAVESALEKGVGDNRGYRCPKEKILGCVSQQRTNRVLTIGYLELFADQWIQSLSNEECESLWDIENIDGVRANEFPNFMADGCIFKALCEINGNRWVKIPECSDDRSPRCLAEISTRFIADNHIAHIEQRPFRVPNKIASFLCIISWVPPNGQAEYFVFGE